MRRLRTGKYRYRCIGCDTIGPNAGARPATATADLMPHGALFQARQALESARYLPRWQQTLLAAALIAGGIALLAVGDLGGVAPLATAGLFVITSIRQRTLQHRSPATKRDPSTNPGDQRLRDPGP